MTTYIVTDRRVAIHQGGLWSNTYSYHLNTLGNLTFHQKQGKRGDISLTGTPIALGNVQESTIDAGRNAKLKAVQNVAQVYELIIAAKEKSAVHEMPVLTETPATPRRVY